MYLFIDCLHRMTILIDNGYLANATGRDEDAPKGFGIPHIIKTNRLVITRYLYSSGSYPGNTQQKGL